MRPQPVAVSTDLFALLPNADFADAFALSVAEPSLDAPEAARRAMGHSPRWIAGLMLIRDAVVRPLGLRTRRDPSLVRVTRIGAFPVIIENEDRVVLGFDDRHLDFRVVIDVAPLDDERRKVTVTTLVETHNWLGRSYLAAILPFHRRVVPSLMAQAGRPSTAISRYPLFMVFW